VAADKPTARGGLAELPKGKNYIYTMKYSRYCRFPDTFNTVLNIV
jgi:hypothetical protein